MRYLTLIMALFCIPFVGCSVAEQKVDDLVQAQTAVSVDECDDALRALDMFEQSGDFDQAEIDAARARYTDLKNEKLKTLTIVDLARQVGYYRGVVVGTFLGAILLFMSLWGYFRDKLWDKIKHLFGRIDKIYWQMCVYAIGLALMVIPVGVAPQYLLIATAGAFVGCLTFAGGFAFTWFLKEKKSKYEEAYFRRAAFICSVAWALTAFGATSQWIGLLAVAGLALWLGTLIIGKDNEYGGEILAGVCAALSIGGILTSIYGSVMVQSVLFLYALGYLYLTPIVCLATLWIMSIVADHKDDREKSFSLRRMTIRLTLLLLSNVAAVYGSVAGLPVLMWIGICAFFGWVTYWYLSLDFTQKHKNMATLIAAVVVLTLTGLAYHFAEPVMTFLSLG